MEYTHSELAILKKYHTDIISQVAIIKNKIDSLQFGQANNTSVAAEILKSIDSDFDKFQQLNLELSRLQYIKISLQNAIESYKNDLDNADMRALNELRRANNGASWTKDGVYIGR